MAKVTRKKLTPAQRKRMNPVTDEHGYMVHPAKKDIKK